MKIIYTLIVGIPVVRALWEELGLDWLIALPISYDLKESVTCGG